MKCGNTEDLTTSRVFPRHQTQPKNYTPRGGSTHGQAIARHLSLVPCAPAGWSAGHASVLQSLSPVGAGGDAREGPAAHSDRVITVDVQDAPRRESFFSKKYLVAGTNSILTLSASPRRHGFGSLTWC
jgi:hypothetical protein